MLKLRRTFKNTQKIQLLEKQIKINIDNYMENKKYIKSLNKNMQKLLSLKQIA